MEAAEATAKAQARTTKTFMAQRMKSLFSRHNGRGLLYKTDTDGVYSHCPNLIIEQTFTPPGTRNGEIFSDKSFAPKRTTSGSPIVGLYLKCGQK